MALGNLYSGVGRKQAPMLCRPSLHECWGLDSKPCGCVTILGKMEDEPRGCPAVEDGSCIHITVLDGGSPESSPISELGEVVG